MSELPKPPEPPKEETIVRAEDATTTVSKACMTCSKTTASACKICIGCWKCCLNLCEGIMEVNIRCCVCAKACLERIDCDETP